MAIIGEKWSCNQLASPLTDASDADWSIYLYMAGQWEPPSSGISPMYLAAQANPDQVLEQALAVLAAHGLS